jgi:hypothetical protein
MSVRLVVAMMSLSLVSLCPDAVAEKQVWRDYEIHYTTLSSMLIPAEVAAAHGLVRGRNHITTSISVIHQSQSTRAVITGTTTNLLNQIHTLRFVEVSEQDAVYYLADLVADKRDQLSYQLSVQPVGQEQAFNLTFAYKYWSGEEINR